MRREIDELFGDVFERTRLGTRREFSPDVDVYYCGEPPRASVKADLAEDVAGGPAGPSAARVGQLPPHADAARDRSGALDPARERRARRRADARDGGLEGPES